MNAPAMTQAKPAATTACSFHCVDTSFRNPGLRYILTVHSGIAAPNKSRVVVP